MTYRPRHTRPRTLGVRLHLQHLLRSWLDAEPDHREALDLIHDLSRWSGYLAAVAVCVAATHGGIGGAARMERSVEATARQGSRRGLSGVAALIRGAHPQEVRP